MCGAMLIQVRYSDTIYTGRTDANFREYYAYKVWRAPLRPPCAASDLEARCRRCASCDSASTPI
jgi:hypothetical protein